MPQYLPINPNRLQDMRTRAADESGNPWTPHAATGGEPLRCCLDRAKPGEDIALISYTPWTTPSPWAETGPVFVHHDPCAGYITPDRYPPEFLASASMLNPFDRTGARAYDHITWLRPDDDHEAVVHLILAQPEVAHLHVRSATAGCFTFAVHPD